MLWLILLLLRVDFAVHMLIMRAHLYPVKPAARFIIAIINNYPLGRRPKGHATCVVQILRIGKSVQDFSSIFFKQVFYLLPKRYRSVNCVHSIITIYWMLSLDQAQDSVLVYSIETPWENVRRLSLSYFETCLIFVSKPWFITIFSLKMKSLKGQR